MKRIRKSKGHYRRLGHLIVKRFLNKAWDKALKQYVNCTYPDFKQDGKIEHILLEEQHYKCCYCMRDLNNGRHITIEHVLPHKEKNKQNIEKYFRYCGNLRKHVRYYLIGQNNNHIKLKVPKYPHFCAYENLVASCDGSIYSDLAQLDIPTGRLHNCCNNARGDDYIIPLFFKRHIGKYIEYDDNGIFQKTDCMPEAMWLDFQTTIGKLRLNQDTLTLFRKAWRIIGECNILPEEVLHAMQDHNSREEIVALMMLSREESYKLNHGRYWALLCQYSYFYQYYKNKK